MERGVYPGTTPLGYVREKDGKMLIDPVAGPALRRVFEGRAGGLPWSKLARQLDAELPRQDGQPWRPATVKAILDSPLYLGRLSAPSAADRSWSRARMSHSSTVRCSRRCRPRGTGRAWIATGDAGGARTLWLLRGRLDARGRAQGPNGQKEYRYDCVLVLAPLRADGADIRASAARRLRPRRGATSGLAEHGATSDASLR